MPVANGQNPESGRTIIAPSFVGHSEIKIAEKNSLRNESTLMLKISHSIQGIPNPRTVIIERVPSDFSKATLSYDGRNFYLIMKDEAGGYRIIGERT